MRYELFIQQGGKKAISVLEGDEFVIDPKKGDLRFFRDGSPLHVVHAGFPQLTGSSSIQLKFQFRNDNAIIPQEADEYARLISGLTWYEARRIGTDAKGRFRYRMDQGVDERTKVSPKDRLSVNTFNGDVCLLKGAVLYREGSENVELIKLASVYSFVEDEIFGNIQLISILSRAEIFFWKVDRGIVFYNCTSKVSYRDYFEEDQDEKIIPSRNLRAVG